MGSKSLNLESLALEVVAKFPHMKKYQSTSPANHITTNWTFNSLEKLPSHLVNSLYSKCLCGADSARFINEAWYSLTRFMASEGFRLSTLVIRGQIISKRVFEVLNLLSPHLTSLTLIGCTFERCTERLKSLSNLRHLCISICFIIPKKEDCFVSFLSACSSVTSLIVEKVERLDLILSGYQFEQLEQLTIQDCKVPIEAWKSAIRRNQDTLISLTFRDSFWELKKDYFMAFWKEFSACHFPSLKFFDFGVNRECFDSEVQSISYLRHICPNLMALHLSRDYSINRGEGHEWPLLVKTLGTGHWQSAVDKSLLPYPYKHIIEYNCDLLDVWNRDFPRNVNRKRTTQDN